MSRQPLPVTPKQIAALPPELRTPPRGVTDDDERRIAALEAEFAALKQTPRNSSLPTKQRAFARETDAGQAAVGPETRRPAPPCQARTGVDFPRTMYGGGAAEADAVSSLRHNALGKRSRAARHQVWELPEIKPLITEYQRHRLTCPRCGETTCGALPPAVPTGQAGPRLAAFVALLMGCFKQSKRAWRCFWNRC
ncbi:MAG: IS66 family transposase zinc-finger binding domain-containing protein [Pirellulales bacterium]|nr:IS66 family transposase zinc-finger binding domain-containing protein [Pirellulales bacterium]